MTERIITGCDAVHPDQRGGQHVAQRCTGVLVIDDDRGVGVLINSERSQHKNIERARKVLAELVEREMREERRGCRACDSSGVVEANLDHIATLAHNLTTVGALQFVFDLGWDRHSYSAAPWLRDIRGTQAWEPNVRGWKVDGLP